MTRRGTTTTTTVRSQTLQILFPTTTDAADESVHGGVELAPPPTATTFAAMEAGVAVVHEDTDDEEEDVKILCAICLDPLERNGKLDRLLPSLIQQWTHSRRLSSPWCTAPSSAPPRRQQAHSSSSQNGFRRPRCAVSSHLSSRLSHDVDGVGLAPRCVSDVSSTLV